MMQNGKALPPKPRATSSPAFASPMPSASSESLPLYSSSPSYENHALLHGSTRDSRLVMNQTYKSKRSPLDSASNSYRISPSQKNRNQHLVLPIPFLLHSGPEKDDQLHNPGKPAKRRGPTRLIPDSTYIRGRVRCFSSCGVLLNFFALFFLAALSVFAFMGYPLLTYFLTEPVQVLRYRGAGPTVAFLEGGRGLIDADTPQEAYRKEGANGEDFRLVFSDEFNTEGRSFWPGDDPYWEGVELHCAATGDQEWYSPGQLTTKDGNLEITIEEVDNPEDNHDLKYISGMLQSWNKFCFTNGYIEGRISLPGKQVAKNTGSTFWAAFWIMGNLGRPGYRATTEGTWPYTTDSCDIGTLANQTDPSGNGLKSPKGFSYLPGQRLSSCTCPGEDHPGPTRADGTFLGRGAPEIDVFEAQNDVISQSVQCAPFNEKWEFDQSRGNYKIQDKARKTYLNDWKGNAYQQAASGVTEIDPAAYEQSEGKFDNYAVQYSSSYESAYITWLAGDTPSWTLNSGAWKADPRVQIGERLMPVEPMAIVLNVAISESFGGLNSKAIQDQLPAKMRVDYIRVYQEEGKDDVGCDTYYAPTANYIADHPEAYTVWNHTIWSDAGYTFPKNRLIDEC